jgi:hypothetical protein
MVRRSAPYLEQETDTEDNFGTARDADFVLGLVLLSASYFSAWFHPWADTR